jgi:uncharacterized protein (TIGR00369 family)
MSDNPPDGYTPLTLGGAFIATNGPFYYKRDGEPRIVGFRVMPRHCNPIGICHGGWLATMADMLLPITAGRLARTGDAFLLTVSLNLDFLGQARLGDWVEGRAELLRKTKRMLFVQGILSVNGEPIARVSGIFRIAAPVEEMTGAPADQR